MSRSTTGPCWYRARWWLVMASSPWESSRRSNRSPAGAPLAGLAGKVRDRIAVPVIDQMAAAVKQAEALVTLGVRKASAGAFRRPDAKSTIGLPEALAARIERRD